MSLREMFRTSRAEQGRQRIDDFSLPTVEIFTDAIFGQSEVRPGSFQLTEEYKCELRVAIKFWANRAELPRASEDAAQTLAIHLYSGILQELHLLRLAIHSGNKSAALEFCYGIENQLKL